MGGSMGMGGFGSGYGPGGPGGFGGGFGNRGRGGFGGRGGRGGRGGFGNGGFGNGGFGDDGFSGGFGDFDSFGGGGGAGFGSGYGRGFGGERGHIVKLRGLPFSATENDIAEWFSSVADCQDVEIEYNKNDKPSGMARAIFASENDAQRAMSKHKHNMHN